jgi:hypothetical protein
MEKEGDVKQKGDRSWLAVCMSTGVVMDVTLNKYSSVLPWWVVLGLWLIPLCLILIWVIRVERSNSSFKERFLRYPVFFTLTLLVLIVVLGAMTVPIVAKLKSLSAIPPQPQQSTSPPHPAPPSVNPPSTSSPIQKTVPGPRHAKTELPPSQVAKTSGACSPAINIQGNGNSTTNVCGPQKYVYIVADSKGKTLEKLFAPLRGKRIMFVISTSTDDAYQFGSLLVTAAEKAGIAFEGDPRIINAPGASIVGANPTGLSISYPDDREDEAKQFRTALKNSGIYTDDIPRAPGDKGVPFVFGVYILPR